MGVQGFYKALGQRDVSVSGQPLIGVDIYLLSPSARCGKEERLKGGKNNKLTEKICFSWAKVFLIILKHFVNKLFQDPKREEWQTKQNDSTVYRMGSYPKRFQGVVRKPDWYGHLLVASPKTFPPETFPTCHFPSYIKKWNKPNKTKSIRFY